MDHVGSHLLLVLVQIWILRHVVRPLLIQEHVHQLTIKQVVHLYMYVDISVHRATVYNYNIHIHYIHVHVYTCLSGSKTRPASVSFRNE